MAAEAKITLEQQTWYADNGANTHITANAVDLTTLQLYDGMDTVQVGNGSGINGPADMKLICGIRIARMNHKTRKDDKVHFTTYISFNFCPCLDNTVYLGAFDDKEVAAHAYDLVALKYWGKVVVGFQNIEEFLVLASTQKEAAATYGIEHRGMNTDLSWYIKWLKSNQNNNNDSNDLNIPNPIMIGTDNSTHRNLNQEFGPTFLHNEQTYQPSETTLIPLRPAAANPILALGLLLQSSELELLSFPSFQGNDGNDNIDRLPTNLIIRVRTDTV
ncbi:hypothetical protein POTOM_025806 [Populus tomentosa]|uniref:AP2/ERF domain-containing protein n=1 Tax=Populus tomentosa TaxID=118781 RepID=A0A8X8CNY4_POPTO|nr:hypothetical protein POTOM_025806 [Populus tomentosa]